MKKNLPVFVLMAVALFSCVEEVRFDPTQNLPDTIVVSGDFTNSLDRHRVLITRPNPYGKTAFVPVTDARVWVVSANDGQRAEYLPTYKQTVADPEFCYELPAGALQAAPGQGYFVEIQLADGRLYRSAEASMPAALPCDSLDAEGLLFNGGLSPLAGGDQRYVQVNVNATLPNDGDKHYLRWEISRVYHFQEFYRDPVPPKTQTFCYIHDFFDRQNIHVQAFANQPGLNIHRRMAFMQIDESYEVRNYFTVVQHTIDEEAFRYWQALDDAANPDGTVFDTPPSPVRGNLYNVNDPQETPLGYFEVAGVDTVRLRVVTTDLGSQFAAPRYCEYKPPFYAYPGEECYCCVLLANSQYEKPWYWQ